MKKWLLSAALALIGLTPAGAATTQLPIGMVTSPCAANVPVVGNGTGAVAICWPNPLGTAAVALTGTNGHVLPYLDAANTWAAGQVLPAPTITGGTAQSLTGLSVRSTGAAFDLALQSNEVLVSNQSLTFAVQNSNRSINLGGNISTGGNLVTSGGHVTLTMTGTTNVTLPISGTLATVDGALGTPTSIVLTNATGMNASNISTGTLPAARLPALSGAVTSAVNTAVTALNTSQTASVNWTGVQTFSGANTVFAPTTGIGGVVLNGPSGQMLTLDVYSAPAQPAYIRMGPTATPVEFETTAGGDWVLNTNGVAATVFTLTRSGSKSGTIVLDKGHIGSTANIPTISACGTSPSAARGSDFGGEVTTGTGALTCTITFGVAYTTAPYCVMSNQSGTVLTYAISTTALTVTAGVGTTNKLNWICSGT